MKHLIIINGFPESGKDHFMDYSMAMLKERCLKLSTVDLVKNVAKILGWNGEKDPVSRKFLSDLKDLSDKIFDTSFNYVIEQLKQPYDVFFVAVREPKNIQRLVDWATEKDGVKVTTVLIRRSEVEKLFYSNHADSNVVQFNYDEIFWNDDSLECFNNFITYFWQNYGSRT